MTATRVAVLTPAGTGAIATVAVVGPEAWAAARALFQPAGRTPLPDGPTLHRFWYGTVGDGDAAGDQVVLAVRHVDPEPCVEIHCHGGRQVVRWVTALFINRGCLEVKWSEQRKPGDGRPWGLSALAPLTHAPTVRTASVLLDQYHGAFDRAVDDVRTLVTAGDLPAARERLDALRRHIPLGRHLVAPWTVVLAGPPNVGKSSLVNALAGYQRSVVSAVPGTTRDVVTTAVAFDGWPVELSDTAGLRAADDTLEAAGVELSQRTLTAADLVVWVLDATAAEPVGPPPDVLARADALLLVVNKIDAVRVPKGGRSSPDLPVSAATGEGIPALIAAIVSRLVPDPPRAGEAVPVTPESTAMVERAHRELANGQAAEAVRTLAAPPT